MGTTLSAIDGRTIRFSHFAVNFASGELRKHGIRLKIAGQPIKILELLLDNPGEVVTRDQIRQHLWPADTFVDFEHSLNAAVNKLREALGDSADNPRFVETVPRRGYRFIGQIDSPQPPPVLVPQTNTQTSSPNTTRRWLPAYLILAVVLISAAAVLYSLASRNKLRKGLPDPPPRATLAVLPFENLSGDPSQEYFSDGITEELSTQLSRINPSRLGVIARMSSARYKHTDKSVRQIGEELGAQYIVEGSVRQDGNQVRITAQLVRVSDQTHLWAANYDRNLSDVLWLQTEVARSVAREIGIHVAVSPRDRRILDPDVVRAYVLAKAQVSRAGFEEAAHTLEQLTVSKPDDPDVWYALALSYFNLAGRVLPQQEMLVKADHALDRSLALDPDSPPAHNLRGAITYMYRRNWTEAEREFQLALSADPSDSRGHFAYALYLSASGRFSEAQQQVDMVNTLEPPTLPFSCPLVRLQYYAGQSREIVPRLSSQFLANPRLHRCYWYALAAINQNQTAGLTQAANILSYSTDLQEPLSIAAYLYGRLGQTDKARRILNDLQSRSGKQFVSGYNLAIIFMGLGDYDSALGALERAADEPNGMLVFLNVDPIWKPLHNNPRFTALMRKTGIPNV